MANGSFGGGDGSVLSPFLVEDALDLNEVREDRAAHYKQVADIDLTGHPNWVPIGGGLELDEQGQFMMNTLELYGDAFTGVYDGDGYTISNLAMTVSDGGPMNMAMFFSLFGVVEEGAVLKNIRLKDFSFHLSADDTMAGFIAGLSHYSRHCEFINCSMENFVVEITSGGEMGGMVSEVGGLLGVTGNRGTAVTLIPTKIEGCSASVTIKEGGMFRSVGGLLARCPIRSGFVMKDCHTSGTLRGVLAGGLVGETDGASALIERSFSTCDIVGVAMPVSDPEHPGNWQESRTACLVGGLLGYGFENTRIENCYATGGISGPEMGVGGLVGGFGLWRDTTAPDSATDPGTGYIKNSYAIGLVAGSTGAGGLVGIIDDPNDYLTANPEYAVVRDSFYNSETSGQSDTGKGVPKTTPEMKDQETFTEAGWLFGWDDLAFPWRIDVLEHDGYPQLQWVTPPVIHPHQRSVLRDKDGIPIPQVFSPGKRLFIAAPEPASKDDIQDIKAVMEAILVALADLTEALTSEP